ncbi:Ig domain-containing protein, partial [Blastococcus sp. SYSU DS0616]
MSASRVHGHRCRGWLLVSLICLAQLAAAGWWAVAPASARPSELALTIVEASLPDATVGERYGVRLDASGGRRPYRWSVTTGSLPPGLSLSSASGRISGRPTASGTSSFTVEAVDRRGTKATAGLELSVTSARLPVQVTSTSLPDATVGERYGVRLHASGGRRPYRWSVTTGSLPPGLSLSSASGRISGRPTAFGTSSFTVEAVDRRGTKATAVLELSVTSARLPVQVTSTS